MQDRLEHPRQHLLATDLGDQAHLGGRQVDVGRREVETLDRGRHHDVLDAQLAIHQHVIDALLELVRVDAHADRHRALRIEVDEQHLAAGLDECGTEVDGGRGLADAALLVAHRDDGGGQSGLARSWAPEISALDGRWVQVPCSSGSLAARPSDERHSTAQIPSLCRPRVGRCINLPQLLDRDQRVDLRRRHRGVSEELLHDAYVRSAVQQMGGERVPQRVRRDV